MSYIVGMNTQVLAARCTSCLRSTVSPRLGRQLCPSVRLASTQSKSRPAKTASASSDLSAIPKKTITTKSTTTTTTAKTTARKKAESTSAAAERIPVTTVKKTTRAASTKTAAASPKTQIKKAADGPSTAKTASTSGAKDVQPTPVSDLRENKPQTTAQGQQAARPSDAAAREGAKKPEPTSPKEKGAQLNPGTGTAPRPSAMNAAPGEHPKLPEKVPERRQPVADRSSPEYKRKFRRWTAGMVAMPILIVTSYYLFDRLVLGNERKDIRKHEGTGFGALGIKKPKEGAEVREA